MLLRRNCFLCTQCPKISVLLFNDGLDMRMEIFSCRHSLHLFSPGAYGFTFFIISHLMLKSVFTFFNFQMWSLRVLVVVVVVGGGGGSGGKWWRWWWRCGGGGGGGEWWVVVEGVGGGMIVKVGV